MPWLHHHQRSLCKLWSCKFWTIDKGRGGKERQSGKSWAFVFPSPSVFNVGWWQNIIVHSDPIHMDGKRSHLSPPHMKDIRPIFLGKEKKRIIIIPCFCQSSSSLLSNARILGADTLMAAGSALYVMTSEETRPMGVQQEEQLHWSSHHNQNQRGGSLG